MKSELSYLELLEQWEEFLRRGQVTELSRSYFKARLNPALIPRAHRLRIASCLRRSNLPREAIRVLEPVVRGTIDGAEPSALELIEYCSNLGRVGAGNEARSRLQRIDAEKEPKVLVLQAMGHVREWDFASAISLLESYIEHDLVGEYQRVVAQVNLIASRIGLGEIERASRELDGIRRACEENEWGRLLANCFELQAQIQIQEQSWDEAEKSLQLSLRALEREKIVDHLLAEKWLATIAAYRTGNFAELDRVQEEARRRGHWETVRALDLHKLRIRFSKELLNHLYHGTPYASFRSLLEREFSGVDPVYKVNGPASRELNLYDGTCGRKTILRPGKNLHRYLLAMTEDFYQPVRLGSLFNSVFEGEEFDPVSSVNRVYQLASRFKKWLKDQKIPLRVSEKDGCYRLQFDGPFALVKTLAGRDVCPERLLFEKLSRAVGNKPFTTKAVSAHLEVSPGKAFLFLRHCENEGWIRKLGRGRKTRFEVVDLSPRFKVG